jgi:MSHA biogenesis protein MshK
MKQSACRHLFGLALLLAATTVLAQGAGGFSDPTRPPGAGAMSQGAQDEPPAGRQLQSVLLSGGRKLAIIDGTMVQLGGMLGDARVVKISETEVVLKNGEELETLRMYPSVDKRPVKRAAGRARAGAAAPQGGSK